MAACVAGLGSSFLVRLQTIRAESCVSRSVSATGPGRSAIWPPRLSLGCSVRAASPGGGLFWRPTYIGRDTMGGGRGGLWAPCGLPGDDDSARAGPKIRRTRSDSGRFLPGPRGQGHGLSRSPQAGPAISNPLGPGFHYTNYPGKPFPGPRGPSDAGGAKEYAKPKKRRIPAGAEWPADLEQLPKESGFRAFDGRAFD